MKIRAFEHALERFEERRMKPLFLAIILLIFSSSEATSQSQTGPAPQVSSGTIVDLGVVPSQYVDPRRVVVWLPTGYRNNGSKYAVLYMHDGQNLFDPKTATYGMEWQIDETLDRLILDKKVRPTIVVGIWSTPKRLQEYLPARALIGVGTKYREAARALYGGDLLGDRYLQFLVHELRPMIDRRFNVKTDRDDTVIMGSSMGATISLYAVDEYPRIFGAAGMMSTHWPLSLKPDGKSVDKEEYEVVSRSFEKDLAASLPDPGSHKLYFDHGSESLDPIYSAFDDRVADVVQRRGYHQFGNLLMLEFPGEKHNEVSWASRVAVPLQFLLPPIR